MVRLPRNETLVAFTEAMRELGRDFQSLKANSKWSPLLLRLEDICATPHQFLHYAVFEANPDQDPTILLKRGFLLSNKFWDGFEAWLHEQPERVAKRVERQRKTLETLSSIYGIDWVLESADQINAVVRVDYALKMSFSNQIEDDLAIKVISKYLPQVRYMLKALPQYLDHCPSLCIYLTKEKHAN